MAFPDEILSRTTRSMGVSFIREMLKATKGVEGMISLAGGLPSPESFPKDLLAGLFKEVVEADGADILQYGATEGDDILKREINRYEGESGVGADELIITDGTTNAIYLFARSVLDPGDVVVCEGPSFSGSLVALEACGAELAPVPMDEEGLVVDRVRETIAAMKARGRAVKFIYAIPDFQNPSGRTMSLARRLELIRVARAEGVLILEDEPYRDLRFYGPRLGSLWNLARSEFGDDRTVTICKSFSKILGPGLRLGFAVGPPALIAAMGKWSQKIIVSPEGRRPESGGAIPGARIHGPSSRAHQGPLSREAGRHPVRAEGYDAAAHPLDRARGRAVHLGHLPRGDEHRRPLRESDRGRRGLYPREQVLPDRSGADERDTAEFLLCDAGRPPGRRDPSRPHPELTGRRRPAPGFIDLPAAFG